MTSGSLGDALVRWLLASETRSLPLTDLLRQLGERLVAAGVLAERLRTSVITKHPEIFVRTFTWQLGGSAEFSDRSRDLLASGALRDSPVAVTRATGAALRCRLVGPEANLSFPVCRELAGEGFTDYIVHPLLFSTGERTFFSFATRAEGGFRADELAVFEALLPALAMRVEIDSATLVLDSLLRVYLGDNAAGRVLDGAFTRGTGVTTEAALWFCDMRGFTSLADGRSAGEVVRILDRFFEATAGSIAPHGGEVLKFIGDAVLAIFPVGDRGPEEACARALAAARDAVEGVRRLAAEPDMPDLGLGVALHLGEVMYGNIGARRRLDFTVIGAAVNEVCRVEALCRSLGPILMTGDFAAHCATEVRSRGVHALKGVSTPRELYSPTE